MPDQEERHHFNIKYLNLYLFSVLEFYTYNVTILVSEMKLLTFINQC